MSVRFLLAICLSVVLIACGSQDYPPPPNQTGVRHEEQPTAPGQPQPTTAAPALEPNVYTPGYVWRIADWIGLPDSGVEDLKCRLQDQNVNHFQALGTTIGGGAILGVIIRRSGSWFFGQPYDPGPGHWFWNRLDETVKTVGQGVWRGGLTAMACDVLLAGGDYIPISGILGHEFAALSAALTLGGLSSMAATPYIEKWIGSPPQAPLNPPIGEALWQPPSGSWPKRVWAKVSDWTEKSEIGRGLRYRIGPRLVIVGVGIGAGFLVYDKLQDGPPVDPSCVDKNR
jgi:hypothetical protein